MKVELNRGILVETNGEDGVTVITEAHGSWSKGWLAQIQGTDPEAPGGLKREFVTADEDHRSRAGNGCFVYRLPAWDALYEADSVLRSYQSQRVAFRVHDGRVEILNPKNTETRAARAALQKALAQPVA